MPVKINTRAKLMSDRNVKKEKISSDADIRQMLHQCEQALTNLSRMIKADRDRIIVLSSVKKIKKMILRFEAFLQRKL